MLTLEEAWAAVAGAIPGPLEPETVRARRRRRSRGRRGPAQRRRPAALRPLGDGRLGRPRRRHLPRRRPAAAGAVAAGEVATAELEPGTAAGVTTGAALPPGADAVLQSELAEAANGEVRPRPGDRAGHPRPLPRRGPARRRRAGARRHARDAAADLRARVLGRRRRRRDAARAAARDQHRQRAAAGRRAARAGPHPRVQRADDPAARPSAPGRPCTTTASCPTTSRPRAPRSRRGWRATCWWSPAGCRSAATTTSRRPSTRAGSRRSSGA